MSWFPKRQRHTFGSERKRKSGTPPVNRKDQFETTMPPSFSQQNVLLTGDNFGARNPLDWEAMPHSLQIKFPHWKDQSIPSPTIKHKDKVEKNLPSPPPKKTGNIPENTIPYIVMDCDTLASIALKFDTSTSDVARVNNKLLDSSCLIFPGELLYIPDSSAEIISEFVHKKGEVFDDSIQVNKGVNHKDEEEDGKQKQKHNVNEEEYHHDVVEDSFLQFPSKFMSEQLCVHGTLFINPQSLMFKPNADDPLVEDNGLGNYEVLIPLCEIVYAYITTAYSLPTSLSPSVSSPLSNVAPHSSTDSSLFSVPSNHLELSNGSRVTKSLPPKENTQLQDTTDVQLQDDLNTRCTQPQTDPNTTDTRPRTDPDTTDTRPRTDPYTTDTRPLTDPNTTDTQAQNGSNNADTRTQNGSNNVDTRTQDDFNISGTQPQDDPNTADSQPQDDPDVTDSRASDDPNTTDTLLQDDPNTTDTRLQDDPNTTDTRLHDSNTTNTQPLGDFSTTDTQTQDDLSTKDSQPQDDPNTTEELSGKFHNNNNTCIKERVRSDTLNSLFQEEDNENEFHVEGQYGDDPAPSSSVWNFLYIRVSQSSQQSELAPVIGIEIPIPRNQSLHSIDVQCVRTWFIFAFPSARSGDLFNFLFKNHPSSNSDANVASLTNVGSQTGELAEGSRWEIINLKGQYSDDSLQVSEKHFASSWEIFSVEDFQPLRIECMDVENSLPLPHLLDNSDFLTTKHIRKLTLNLVSAAVGYDWYLIYSTFKHGISLQTLYRNMANFGDTPTVLIVRDEFGKLFGAMLSCSIKRSDRFYGTGESLLFSFNAESEITIYPWTGSNDYIIKGSADSIAIGSGDGHFGLWLDEDFFHGSSLKCLTYDNDVLSTEEAFKINGVEAWGFM